MSKNEFDELLLKKLREADFEYNPASWDKLSQLLPETTPSGEDSFDELLIKKLQGAELEYKEEHWEQLAAMLPPTLVPAAAPNKLTPATHKKWAVAASVAALLILATGTGLFLNRMSQTPAVETALSIA